jgi:hypothetical protein
LRELGSNRSLASDRISSFSKEISELCNGGRLLETDVGVLFWTLVLNVSTDAIVESLCFPNVGNSLLTFRGGGLRGLRGSDGSTEDAVEEMIEASSLLVKDSLRGEDVRRSAFLEGESLFAPRL